MSAPSTNISSGQGHQREAVSDRGLPSGIAVWVTLVSALVFYTLTSHATFNPFYDQPQAGFAGSFFLSQAQVLVHGHLAVSPAQLPGECWVYRGRCYAYYGLTPSLLRVPFLPLLNAENSSASPVYMTVALALAVGSALAICFRALATVKRTRLVYFLGLALAVSLGPASVLAVLARPAMYEEAIAWGVGFGLLAIYCFLRWWSDHRRLWGTLLVVSLTLGANARPTILALAVMLAAGIAVDTLLARGEAGRKSATLLFAATVVALPVATALGVFWLKFHDFLPSMILNEEISGPGAVPSWLALRRVDHNSLSGLRFVPTALLAYLRPDSVAFSSAFPFVNFRFGTGLAGLHLLGLPPGSMLTEPWSTLTDDMPGSFVIVIAGTAGGIRAVWHQKPALRASATQLARSPLTYCVLGTAASCGITLTQCYITNRYLGDFFPLIVVLVSLAALPLLRATPRLSRRGAYVLVGGFTVLVVWSLLVNLGLEYQDWWHTTIPTRSASLADVRAGGSDSSPAAGLETQAPARGALSAGAAGSLVMPPRRTRGATL